jgi:RND family efflux transporter MFP subunit
MSRTFITSMAAAGGLSILVLAQTACGGGTHAQREQPADPLVVTAVPVSASAQASRLEAGGLVHARTSALVTSRIMAPVREVRVTPGDRVRAGQVLVVLDDRDLGAMARRASSGVTAAEQAVQAVQADVESAAAALTLATASHARIAGLHERRSATSHELDEATAALRAAESRAVSARARVREAEAALESARAGSDAASTTAGFALITAPFAGVVSEKLVEPGNMASPGTPLLRLEDTRGFRLDVRLDANRAAALPVGTPVEVTVDAATPRQVSGRVSEVSRALESDGRTVLVKIDLPDDDALRTGLFGRAVVPGPPGDALTVPASAIVRRGQVTSVFVVDEDVARLRMVVLGRSGLGPSDAVEVTAGLGDGERVVSRPPAGLSDGAPVRVEGR